MNRGGRLLGTKLIIGTSGYSYEDWRGAFYPETLSRNEFLTYYAGEFNGVELNFTYYSMPGRRTIERMVEFTPEEFSFSVKANKLFTHVRDETALEAVPSFLAGLAPLLESGKLSALLFQFPYSFHYNKETRVYLKKLIGSFRDRGLTGTSIAVEFRNTDWLKASVIDTFKKENLTLVEVDLPELKGLPLPDDTVTSDTGYIRFHGRNKSNWWKGDNVSRYDYLYTREELSRWKSLISRMTKHVKILLIFFNNHHKGKAVLNARMLKKMLD